MNFRISRNSSQRKRKPLQKQSDISDQSAIVTMESDPSLKRSMHDKTRASEPRKGLKQKGKSDTALTDCAALYTNAAMGFLLLSGTAGTAYADNECGPATVGGNVTCDAGTYTTGPNDDIRYPNIDGLTLTADNVTVSGITDNNRQAVMIGAQTATHTGDLHLTAQGGSVLQTGNPGNIGSAMANTEGRYSDGLRAEQRGQGSASVVLIDSSVTTYGYNASGIYAWQRDVNPDNTGDVVVNFSGDSRIETWGVSSHGVFGRAETGIGNVLVDARDGAVITRGNNSRGIQGLKLNSAIGDGNVTVTVDGVTVTTHGTNNSVGIRAMIEDSANSRGDVSAFVRNGTAVETFNQGNSHGIHAVNQDPGLASIELEDSSVITHGDTSIGVLAQSTDGDATVLVTNGIITTEGADAHALEARAGNISGNAAVTLSGGSAETAGNNAVGVLARSNANNGAATVSLTDGATATTTGTSAHALEARVGVSGDATVTLNEGSAATTGNNAIGVFARSNDGAATVSVTDGVISTQGNNAHALEARTGNVSGDATVTLNSGSVETAGNDAEGLFALVTNGIGKAFAAITGGKVETSGTNSDGVIAQVDDGSLLSSINGDASAVISGGEVITSGNGSAGVIAQTDLGSGATGNATVTQSGGSVTTAGGSAGLLQGSYGLLALSSGSGTASIEQSAGSVTTSGEGAHGLYALSLSGDAVITQGSSGEVTASGKDASGIRAQAANGNTVTLDGQVTSGSGNAAAVHASGGSNSTITISSGAVIDGTASGVAIREENANTLVSSAGQVTGDVIMGGGNDTLNLTDGTLDGDIYGDNPVANAGDGNDDFNWTGGTWSSGSSFLGG